MFGEIQKIFDRNFIVGYLLPSAAFLAFCLDVTHGDDLKAVWGFPDYIGFILLAFGLGIVLLGANRTITRILEGYDRANPLRILTPLQRLRLRRLQRRRALLDAQYTHATERGGQIPESVEKARIEVMVRLAERYPDDEKWLLPSAFGNVMRACEIYPRVMYGLEIVEGWPRLLAVVPKDHQQLLETAKADTDLWVNVWFLSLLTIVDLLATSIHREWCIIHSLFSLTYQRPSARMIFDQFLLMTTPNDWPVWLACLGTFVVGLFGSWMAAKAAIGWGALLKSTTDVFLAEPRQVTKWLERTGWASVRRSFTEFPRLCHRETGPENLPLTLRTVAREKVRNTKGHE